MVLRWYESLVPYEENYFLKTKNFVPYADDDALFAPPSPGPGVRSRIEMIYKMFFLF